MRYLAVDYGNRRTGLAICDAMEIVASPLCIVQGQKGLIEKIAQIAESEEVDAFVIGLPFNMDGSEGDQAKKSREFGKRLAKVTGMEVYFQDERLTSYAAGEKLKSAEYSHRKRKERLDAVAAAEILRAFLDSHKAAQ